MAEEDGQDPEVEQRAAPAQQPVLVELRRPGRPAELVVAVAPHVADDEGRQADVGHDHPQEGVHPQPPPRNVGIGSSVGPALEPGAAGPGSKPGVAYGVSPTSSAGGPSAASRLTASTSSPPQGREGGRHGLDRPGPPGALLGQRHPEQLQAGPVVEQQPSTLLLVDGGGVLQDDREVVGQLGADRRGLVDGDAGGLVGLLEAQQREAALAGVAVGEVGQEEVVAAPAVEGLDVVGLEVRQRQLRERGDAAAQRAADGSGSRSAGLPHQREVVEQVLVGVAQQQRGRLPRDEALLRGQLAAEPGARRAP